jgi:CheY-like chemotaxis protein
MTRIALPETLALSELRNLRRYTFCLLGNRSLSDIIVEATLNALVSEAATVSGWAISRLDLYRKVNERVRANTFRDRVQTSLGSTFHTQVLALPLQARQIVMLRTIVGLPDGDIASIMHLSEGEVRRIYAASLQALRDKPIDVLIIEDEALIAWELSQIVTRLGLSVVGTAKNKTEALRLVGISKPSLIFADYRLRGETGVDVVRAIREQIDAGVIYVTAHPDVIARQGGASKEDIVVSKPFSAQSIEQAVQTYMAA